MKGHLSKGYVNHEQDVQQSRLTQIWVVSILMFYGFYANMKGIISQVNKKAVIMLPKSLVQQF